MLDKYKATLNAAQKDYDVLAKRREHLLEDRELINDQIADLDTQMQQLAETILSLSRLCGVELSAMRVLRAFSYARLGLTDAIRKLLKTVGSWLSAIEVRDRLLESGFDTTGYNENILATVHTTLKRLHQSDELLKEAIEGKTVYKLNPNYISRIARMEAPKVDTPFSVDLKLPSPTRMGLLKDNKK